jgi:hypothetical protein
MKLPYETPRLLAIPILEKIAELERRITGLELRMAAAENALRRRVVVTKTVSGNGADLDANPHWRGLWREFDALMKSIFKVKL